jgi:hypothetical protein
MIFNSICPWRRRVIGKGIQKPICGDTVKLSLIQDRLFISIHPTSAICNTCS